MSTKGRTKEYKDERDRSLLEAYHKTLAETAYPIKLSNVYEEVVKQPSPQFWISSEQAIKIISDIKRGVKDLSTMRHEYASMITTIMERMEQIRENNPELSDKLLVERVIYDQAPCYFITPKSAKTLIHRFLRRCRGKAKE